MKYLLGLILTLGFGLGAFGQNPEPQGENEDSFICYQVDENTVSCYSDYDPALDEQFQQGVTPEGDIYSMEEGVVESPEESDFYYGNEELSVPQSGSKCEENKKANEEALNSPENYVDKSKENLSSIGDQERGKNTVNKETCEQLEGREGKSFGEPYSYEPYNYDFEESQCMCPNMYNTTEGDYRFGNPDEQINPEDKHVETNVSTDEGGLY